MNADRGNSTPSLALQIAHEMRGPLMGIKGLAATARRAYDQMGETERLEFFDLIDQEADRLLRVTEQTAFLLQLEAGEVSFDIEDVPLAPLIERVAEAHPRVEAGADPGVTALCDAARTEWILEELIRNAERFSPENEPVRVEVRAGGAGAARIEVTDRGPGLDAAGRDAAFRPFAAIRPKGYEDVPGAGLGLYLARALAVAQGGLLRMEPARPRGTMLAFTLPVEVEP